MGDALKLKPVHEPLPTVILGQRLCGVVFVVVVVIFILLFLILFLQSMFVSVCMYVCMCAMLQLLLRGPLCFTGWVRETAANQ